MKFSNLSRSSIGNAYSAEKASQSKLCHLPMPNKAIDDLESSKKAHKIGLGASVKSHRYPALTFTSNTKNNTRTHFQNVQVFTTWWVFKVPSGLIFWIVTNEPLERRRLKLGPKMCLRSSIPLSSASHGMIHEKNLCEIQRIEENANEHPRARLYVSQWVV